MKNFWDKLPRPFFVLAPMADVTDCAFRRIVAKYGKLARTAEWRGGPDVLWTEFVSADGLLRADARGRARLLRDLVFSEAERPIVAQLFTARPEIMARAARLVLELGFDGLDINMGCPDRKVEKQGAGAALIKNQSLAREIIMAARAGVSDKLPVSVKTRIGYARDELDTWLPALLTAVPAAVTLHARTRAEMSKTPARWDTVARAVVIRNQLASRTLIIGNGDTPNLEAAKNRARETGADGVMLGRAILGNPWLFGDKGETFEPQGLTLKERLRVLVEHAKLFEELLGDVKSFAVMKKHFKAYLSGFSHTTDLNRELMAASDATAVTQIVDKFGAIMLG